jgi:outer membrane receptor for ferric coprogen and ferric-rhodotorulic acid
VFDLTDNWSIFAVHATSLFPDTGKDSFGSQFAPIEGESLEGGFKYDSGDNKLSGTLSFFQIQQTGGTQFNPNKLNAQGLLGDLDAGGEQESTGIELDLVYSPLSNWQLMFSYANVDQEITESFTPATIGQSTPQLVKDRYAFLTRYTFDEGPVEGLYVGLGVTGGSKVLIDYKPDASGTLTPRYEPGRTVLDFFSGYRFKVADQDALIQLNVSNLTSADDYAGWVATGSPTILATERYKVPTSPRVRLTFGVDF